MKSSNIFSLDLIHHTRYTYFTMVYVFNFYENNILIIIKDSYLESDKRIVDSLTAYYQKQGPHVSGAKRCEEHQGGENYFNEVLDAFIKALLAEFKQLMTAHYMELIESVLII